MTAATYKTVVEALERMRGDDLYRARAAFRGFTPEQMQEQHGASGQTRAQILTSYEKHEARVNSAIVEITQLAGLP